MSDPDHDPGHAVEWLEGLVLRDSAGRFYEMPLMVVERYRVSEARAEELAGQAASDVHGFAERMWIVAGGIYARPSGDGRATRESGQR
jgi:hypothetical protein